MVNTNLLRAEWVKKGLTQEQVAKELGICSKTLIDRMKKHCFRSNEIEILISLGEGECCAEAWGCDLSYDYVKINGDYRT